MECYDPSWVQSLPGDRVGVGQNLCTPEQTDECEVSCIDSATASAGLCGAWYEDDSNLLCAGCLITANDWSPIPAVLNDGAYWYLPVYACEAMAAGRPECAWPLQAYAFCVMTACIGCEQGPLVGACHSIAEAGVCSHPAISLPSECLDILETTQEQPSPHCDGQDSFEAYDNVASYFCGPPA